MVLSGEEGADGKRVLCEDDGVDWREGRVAERSQKLNTVEVVHAHGSVEATRDEEAHRIANKD